VQSAGFRLRLERSWFVIVVRSLCVFLSACGGLSARLIADDGQRKAPTSLDAQLLDDLDSELLEGLTPPAQTEPSAGQAPEIVGEDIGAADTAGDDPLTRIEQKMRQVEQRLAERDSSTGTQTLQREIADELAALLEQLQQQQQQNQNQNQNNQNSQQQQQQSSAAKKQDQKQASKSNPSNQPASKPARESEERTGKVDDEKIKPEDLQDLIQSAWGNLPPQVREKMESAAQEQFLPKYQTLIEDYFKRLAEEKR
jgi:chemotaxis protein histidine kinase CheA